MKLRTLAAVLLVGWAAPPAPHPANDHSLQAAFDQIASRSSGRSATWGALAVSLATGDTLFARNADLALAPASNMKLLTTAAAFHLLGPEFRFRTFVLATAPPDGGSLEGDVILYGTGDPALSNRFTRGRPDPLEALADVVAAQGIRWIRGDLIADGSFLTGATRSSEWPEDDLDEWYSAPVAGLSYNENLVTLRTTPARVAGQPPLVEVLPPIGRELVVNEARTRPGRGRPDLVITRTETDGPIRVVGSIAAVQRPIWKRMTVADPSRFAGQSFRGLLEERGVTVAGQVRVIRDPDDSPLKAGPGGFSSEGEGTFLHTLATYESPPLKDYLDIVNQASNNFFAESVFKALGRVVVGTGTFEGGRIAVEGFLRENMGITSDHVIQRDGSGLAPRNQVTAGALVALLRWVHQSPHREEFVATLPIAGRRRRGLGRMYQTPAAGNLRAKTGTIEAVSALSGFVTSADGEPIAFSLISNGIRSRSLAKRLEDQIGATLAGWRRAGGA